MKNFITITFLILSISTISAQQIFIPAQNEEETAQTQEMKSLIVGVWLVEGASFQDRVEYNQNGTLIKYSENGNEYCSWQVYTKTTESGLEISKLVVQCGERNFNYSIDTLNDERMMLIYMVGGHLSRNPYIRQ
jgi:hypothetical protein